MFGNTFTFDRHSRRQSRASTSLSNYSTVPSSPTTPSQHSSAAAKNTPPSSPKQPAVSRFLAKAGNVTARKPSATPTALSKRQQQLLTARPQPPAQQATHEYSPSANQETRSQRRRNRILPVVRLGHKQSTESVWGTPVDADAVAMGLVTSSLEPQRASSASSVPHPQPSILKLPRMASATNIKRMRKGQASSETIQATLPTLNGSPQLPVPPLPCVPLEDIKDQSTSTKSCSDGTPAMPAKPQILPTRALRRSLSVKERGSRLSHDRLSESEFMADKAHALDNAQEYDLMHRISPFPLPPVRSLYPHMPASYGEEAALLSPNNPHLATSATAEQGLALDSLHCSPQLPDKVEGHAEGRNIRSRKTVIPLPPRCNGPRHRPLRGPPPNVPLPPTPDSSGAPRLPHLGYFRPLLPPTPTSPVRSTFSAASQKMSKGEAHVEWRQAQGVAIVGHPAKYHGLVPHDVLQVNASPKVFSEKNGKDVEKSDALSWNSSDLSDSDGAETFVTTPSTPASRNGIATPSAVDSSTTTVSMSPGRSSRKGAAAEKYPKAKTASLSQPCRAVKDRPPTPGGKAKTKQHRVRKHKSRPSSPSAARAAAFTQLPPIPPVHHEHRRLVSSRRPTSIYFLDPENEVSSGFVVQRAVNL